MRLLHVFDFQVIYMLYWRFTLKRKFQSIVHLLNEKWTYILDFGPWRWSALNMGYMNKQPSIPVKENMHKGQNRTMKDSRSKGQDFWRTTPWYWRNYTKRQLLLCWSGGDIREERRLGRDARTCGQGSEKFLGGNDGGGANYCLSRRTKLVGVSLVSAMI